jgi:hypothetical protein
MVNAVDRLSYFFIRFARPPSFFSFLLIPTTSHTRMCHILSDRLLPHHPPQCPKSNFNRCPALTKWPLLLVPFVCLRFHTRHSVACFTKYVFVLFEVLFDDVVDPNLNGHFGSSLPLLEQRTGPMPRALKLPRKHLMILS